MDRAHILLAPRTRGCFRFFYGNGITLDDELYFGIWQQHRFLADFDGKGNLAFTGDAHEEYLTRNPYLAEYLIKAGSRERVPGLSKPTDREFLSE